ncbi:MAG: InlB B-repeat-containing protein [Schaedlerella sp.]|nr:InlB B-repeat-containing protein [Schaedlerella sp.]
MATLLKSVTGSYAGPGPSYFRVVAQLWLNEDTGSGYDMFLRRFIEVKAGSGFNGTVLTTSWAGSVSVNSAGRYASVDTQLGVVKYGNAYQLPASSIKAYYYDSAAHLYSSSTSISYTVSKPTYKVVFDDNGGSNGPADQTKTYGVNLTLSSTVPVRTGCNFKNWNTKADGSGTSYSAGASYTANAGVTLYAQWTRISYLVTYNANGGSGAPASQTKYYGIDLILSSTIPTMKNHEFLGWAASKTAEIPEYLPGAKYTGNAALTLYAVWTQKGMLHFTQNGQAGKGRPYLKHGDTWESGIPWIKKDGMWKKGGV